jgi:hypothetical protein
MAKWATVTVTVKEPDVIHNHWGVVIQNVNEREAIPECDVLVNWWLYMRPNKEELQGFHQGGHHGRSERCGGRHYIEFWGFSGDKDHRSDVEDRIARFKSEVTEVWGAEFAFAD